MPAQVFELIAGWAKAYVAHALTKLNVFEAIGKDVITVREAAAVCGVNEGVLYRALRFANQAGLVKLEDRQVALTEPGCFFLKDTPGNMAGSMEFLTAPPWRDSWQNFSLSLQTGRPAFDQIFGKSFFSYLDENQEYGKPFNDMMTTRTTMMAPLITQAYDFSNFQTICDVGGGQGILLKTILEKNPRARGILYDLESAMLSDLLDDMDDRVTKVSGSFFEFVPSAECLILKHIIHDWSDENSIHILQNCRAAMPDYGRILLVENVIQEPFDLVTLFYDLHMQVMIGGAERTEEEFGELLAAAGLKMNRVLSTPLPIKIIEVIK